MKALAICIVCVTFVRADTIELKTGERIEGTLKQTNATTATLDQSGRITTIPIGQIRTIYFGSSAPSASAPSTSAGEPWAQALDAVRGLRSVAKSGVAYRDYAPRVLDAKVIVDRYIEAQVGSAKVRSAIKFAMDTYVLASRSWNVKIARGDSATIGADIKSSLAVTMCEPAKKTVLFLLAGSNYPENNSKTSEAVGDHFANHPEILLACAATRVADAEAAAEGVR